MREAYPPFGVPPETPGTVIAALVALGAPNVLCAVTRHASRRPESAVVKAYPLLVAPLIGEPSRNHSKVNVGLAVQVPGSQSRMRETNPLGPGIMITDGALV